MFKQTAVALLLATALSGARAHAAEPQIACAEDQRPDTRVHQRARAHGARL